jgi:hypothetical protein
MHHVFDQIVQLVSDLAKTLATLVTIGQAIHYLYKKNPNYPR